NTTLGHAGTGLFHQGYATDVIADWQAGEDTLVVLSNGVAVIGGLRQSTADGGAQINMNLGNTIDLRDVAATATSDQNESGARGNDGLDAVPNLETAFIAQATRDSKSIENENDISVVNEGLIVARGLGGDDILFGSAGDDYLYGNTGDNIVILSEGGSDRVYYDTFNGADARHFVSDFNRSGDAETDTSGDDLFFVNKRVIDAFGGNTARALTADDVGGTYTQAVTYNPRINFLHDNFYSPPILTPNTTHDNEDGQAPSNMFGSDGTTFGIGVGMTAVGYVLMGVPFAQAIGAALIASGSALSVGSVFVHTDEHKNATYDGDVSNYLNVITADTQQTVGNTVVATQAGVEDSNVSFLDFFRGSNAGDGFIPVVEFTNSNVNGVYGYFALHSNTETFVYLVASADNLVENGEAIKVAEINGLLTADDFRVYDGEADIYNVGTEPDVVLSTPAVTQVADAASNSGMGDQLIDDVQGAVKVTIDVADGIVAGSTLRVYDGTTLIYDSSNQTLVDADVTAVLNGNTYTLSDNRPLGTVAQQTDTADIDTDNAFVLRDTNVIYSVELRDGVTGIPTRAASPSIKITGGTGVIDGGLGADMLTVSGTSDFMNTATDAQIIGMETISLSAVDTNLDTVVDANDNPVVLDLSNQTDGFNIYGSSLADTITGSDGDDTVVGLSGQDYIDLGGLGNDEVTFTYLNDNLGNDNAYDTVVGLDSTDKMFVAAGGWVDHDDDSATADQRRDGFEDRDGDTTRLMYEMSTSATSNTNVSSGTELLIVSQSSVSTTGDLTNNIAAALSSAFNLAGLDGNVPSPTSGGGTDSSVLFAVKSDDASYWVGRYEDREGDDYAVGSEIEVFARVSADNILNSFWLDTVLAPQALTLTMPTDTGRNDGAGTYYTNDNTFEVGGLQSGNSIYYSLNGGSDWATAPVDQTFVTLAQGTYSPGSIKIRQVDPDGNYSNYSYETTSSSKTVVVDTMANAVTLTDEINGQTSADTVVLNWGTAGGAAPNADIDVYYKLGTGSYTAVDLSAGATSLHLGTLSVGTYTWYVTSTDAAGNTGASAQDTFTIVSPAPAQVAVWDSIETGDPQSANTQIGASLANSYVSLGEFTPTVANNSGVTGSHYVNVNDNDIMFDFDQNAQINGITVNSVKFGKYDNTGMATPSYGVSQTDWVFYVNDLVSDVGSSDHRTGEDYRLDVDLTISMLDGGTTTFDRTFYIDFEAAP
ncbi:MAG: hypothetical protein ABF288_10235, partial [Octadecabacter sp.]